VNIQDTRESVITRTGLSIVWEMPSSFLEISPLVSAHTWSLPTLTSPQITRLFQRN